MSEKSLEEELRASQERYQAFISQSSEGIWRCELDEPMPIEMPEDAQINYFYEHGVMAECNDAMAHMYGLSATNELVGARLDQLLVRSDPKNVEFLRAFIRSGYRLSNAESHETDKDGRDKFFLNNFIGVIVEGKLHHAWGTQRDVTDQRAAEEIFRRQARVLESMSEGVSVSDENGLIVYTNPAEDRMFGYEPGELLGKHISIQTTNPKDTHLQLVNEINTQLRESGVWEGEFTSMRKDGTPFTTRSHITTIRVGQRPHWVSVKQDITREKEAYRELAESRQMFQRIAEASPEVIYVYDLALRQNTYINREITSLLGYQPHDVRAMGESVMATMVHPDDLAGMVADYQSYGQLRDGQMLEREYRIRHVNGEYRWLHNRSVVFRRDANGHPLDILGVAQDVTERKKADAFLRNSHDELERRVAERTELLMKANEEKEVLIKEIHHRVKNNMQIISSLLRLQSQTIRDQNAEQIFQESQTRIRSMALIHESLYQSDNLNSINFHEYAARLVESISSAYQDPSRTIKIELKVEPVVVDMDTAMPCGLIIAELVTNSFKYAFPNDTKGKISVGFKALANIYELEIRDDGVGNLEKMSNTPTLGFQIVQLLVKQLKATFDRVPTRGTGFRIAIPKPSHNPN